MVDALELNAAQAQINAARDQTHTNISVSESWSNLARLSSERAAASADVAEIARDEAVAAASQVGGVWIGEVAELPPEGIPQVAYIVIGLGVQVWDGAKYLTVTSGTGGGVPGGGDPGGEDPDDGDPDGGDYEGPSEGFDFTLMRATIPDTVFAPKFGGHLERLIGMTLLEWKCARTLWLAARSHATAGELWKSYIIKALEQPGIAQGVGFSEVEGESWQVYLGQSNYDLPTIADKTPTSPEFQAFEAALSVFDSKVSSGEIVL